MNGLDPRQLLEYVIRPTLKALGNVGSIPLWTRSAERLVLGTAAYESGLRQVRQFGNGPALGLWQIEPATYRSLVEDLVNGKPELRQAVLAIGFTTEMPPAERLVTDLALGAAFCRLRYLWDPHPLPDPDDKLAMAETYKRAYNTYLGKGTTGGFIRAWDRHVAPVIS